MGIIIINPVNSIELTNIIEASSNKNIERIHDFTETSYNELKMLRHSIEFRLEEIQTHIDKVVKETGKNLKYIESQNMLDINMYFKAYLLIYRLILDNFLDLIYIYESTIKAEKVKSGISISNDFNKFYKNLLRGNYDAIIGTPLLHFLKKNAKDTILIRCLRNNLKYNPNINSCLLLDKNKKLVISMNLDIRDLKPSEEVLNESIGIKDGECNYWKTDDLVKYIDYTLDQIKQFGTVTTFQIGIGLGIKNDNDWKYSS